MEKNSQKNNDVREGLKRVGAGFLIAAVLVFSTHVNRAFSEDQGVPPEVTATSTEEVVTPSEDATVETGDAVAETTTENSVNTNTASLNEPDTDTTSDTEEESLAADTEGANAETVVEDEDLPPPSGDVENTNDAVVENTASTTAETGANTAAAGGSGTASVKTGDAIAAGNVINVVNTNVVNSSGVISLLNILFGTASLDLRGALSFFDGSGNAVSNDCSLEKCGAGDLKVVNNNNAEVVNDIVVRADTGGNAASANGGDASVKTGNAYAAANLINVVNSNFVNSNYLLLSVNAFGGLGDLVLPNADFFQNFLSGSGIGGGTTITNTNTASVTNNVEATAETGGNTATTTDGSAVVDTGSAVAGSSVVNQVNTSLIGGSNFFLLVRVYGNWAGQIFSAPSGISWSEGPDGIKIFSDSDTGSTSGSALEVDNTNHASVLNNVSVVALTGDNKVGSAGGTASVDTGTAIASANVINVVNTNVIGRNWMFAILNIFGDWSGNISFGQPDLWLGAAAQTSLTVDSGTTVPFTFTVTNHGDADATNVIVKPKSVSHLSFGETQWKIGTVKKGETVEITKNAKVTGSLPFGSTPVTLSVSTSATETDANTSDNNDELTLTLSRADRGLIGAPRPDAETLDPVWKITKTSSATSTIPAGSSVTYTVIVQNDGGPAYNAILEDTIRDATGDVVTINRWNLDTVAAGEEIRVTYTVAFGTSMKPGVYTNEAHVTARSRSSAPQYSVEANSNSASTDVTLGPPLPVVSAHKLELSNVRITSIGASRDTALVEWDTNVPATSKVVFGPTEGDYTYNLENGQYFGYPGGSSQDDTKTKHHRVLLSGLEPGEAYKYRAVSFASPGVASDEYDFALDLLSKPTPAATGAVAMADTLPKVPAKAPLAIEGWDGASNIDEEPATVSMVPTSSMMQLAAVIGVMNDDWINAILLVLSLFFFLILFGNKKSI